MLNPVQSERRNGRNIDKTGVGNNRTCRRSTQNGICAGSVETSTEVLRRQKVATTATTSGNANGPGETASSNIHRLSGWSE